MSCLCIILCALFITVISVIPTTAVKLNDTLVISGKNEVTQGDDIKLTCGNASTPITWTFNNQVLPDKLSKQIRSVSVLTISNVQLSHYGNYTCNADDIGNATVTVLVTPLVDVSKFTGFHNVKRFQSAVTHHIGGLLQATNIHQEKINITLQRYIKLEKWLTDMQIRIRLDSAETNEMIEGQQKKLHDLSEQLDEHGVEIQEQKQQIRKLSTINQPGASISREIEGLRREMFELQSNQLSVNETLREMKNQVEQFRGVLMYIETTVRNLLDDAVSCDNDDDCKDTYYCSITTKGKICELKSPKGTFCLRGNKCLSGRCNWRGRCD